MLPPTRKGPGWILLHVRDDTLSVFQTSIDVADEVWLMLHQVSEVSERGQDLIRTLQPGLASPDVTETWRDFRAFVRQAESFYRAAVPLTWKSAPLNYYYSFLNLAKGILTLHGELPHRKVRHGLSSVSPSVNSGVGDWRVVVRDGVFPLLYQQRFAQAIPQGTELSVCQLLAYSSPVQSQYQESDFGMPKTIPCNCVLRTSSGDAWTLLAMPKVAKISAHPLLGPSLAANYREVEPPKDFAREAFGFHAVATASMQFFEAIDTVPFDGIQSSDLLEPLLEALPDAVEAPTVSEDSQFVLNLPYDTGSGFFPMSEMVATYAVIFFLSELVRYYPERLDHISETNDGWVVESFVRSFPTHMLRFMLTATLGRTVILKRS